MTREERKEYYERYVKSERGVVSEIYKSQRQSSKRRGHELPAYTKKELEIWLYENNFKELYDNWVESLFDRFLKPSVDRLDDSKGYSFDNVQLITWGENDRKAKVFYIGENSPSSNDKSYYKSNPVFRYDFKVSCERMGWNFNEFNEVVAEEDKWYFHKKTGKKTKRYYYVYK